MTTRLDDFRAYRQKMNDRILEIEQLGGFYDRTAKENEQ